MRASLILLLGLLAWQYLAAPALAFLPSPWEIGAELGSRTDSLWSATLTTGTAAAIGFVIGCVVAITLALIALASPAIETATLRLGLALYAVPIIVVAPIFVLWFGPGLRPRVALSALAVFFGVLVNTIRGFRSISEENLSVLYVLAASRTQILRYLRVPSALPYVLNGFKIAAPASVFGAVVGEWVGADQGLGVVLIFSLYQYQVPLLWTAMLLTTLLALAGYGLFGLSERVLIPWHQSVRASRVEQAA